MVEIHRVWVNVDTEDDYKIRLFNRPRVSIHVDEYIWNFIKENIVKPHKIMRSENNNYMLSIAYNLFDPEKQRYFPLSPYNGQLRDEIKMDSANGWYFREDFSDGKKRTNWFCPSKIWTSCGNKVIDVGITAANVSENITPREYADLLFDGIGAALMFNFKRLKREEFEQLKLKIDWSIVEGFPFPASFEDQQYIGDEGIIHVYSWDGRKETTLVGPYSVRELYLEHFGESQRGVYMVKDIRECLLEQAARFHQWQERVYPGRMAEEIGGEWEVDYPGWNDTYDAFCCVLTQVDAEAADDVLLDEMAYLIARDNEAEGLMKKVAQYPQWFEILCHHVVRSAEHEAKWQFAAYLPECGCGQNTQNLILDFAKDNHEYVSRRALLAMPSLWPERVEKFAALFWNKICYPDDWQEYQRIAVLVALNEVHSALLPRYLELAKRDGRTYLMQHVERIEREKREEPIRERGTLEE